MENRIWCAYPRWNGRLEVSNDGYVRNTKTGRVLKPRRNNHGYMSVYTSVDGVDIGVNVHRMIATCFIPGYFEGADVNHKNGDKTDNRLPNLEWVTRAENIRHAFKVLGKKAPQGSKHGRSKLTEEQVRAIKASATTKAVDLARQFQIDQSVISDIRRGKIWTHV